MELNDKAKKVFALKYSTKKTKAWKETCRDIADFIAEGERPYGKSNEEIKQVADKFYEYLYDLMFIPGGRIIANAGTGIKNLANCFVLGIEDSRTSIYHTLGDAAEVFAMGGGVGYSFSKLREEGADVQTTGGKASGPLSFMSLFDQTGEVIQQASRRGAQLGSLDVSHPDIEKFIHFKSQLNSRNTRLMDEYERNLHLTNGGKIKATKYEKVLEKTLLDDQLTHFNISVLLRDDFMNAVKNNADWDLISPSTGNVVKTVKAKDILYQMAEQAWESGDPGQLQYHAINRDNMVKYIGDIKATNPCFFPDTLIETINGRIPIKDITKETFVYSMDENKKLTIKKASASWVSRKNSETLIITINNGRKLIVTPDHQLYSKKRGWIEAKNLILGEELVGLCRARRGAKYSGVKLSSEHNRAYRMEHKFIYENINGKIPDNFDIHHIDNDSYHNVIDNFELLSHDKHSQLTALTQPNNHQINSKETGKFITHPNSKKGRKTLIQMPYELRSDFIGQPRVVSIENGPISDVYDISVEGTNNLIANYMVAHNCGEVPLLEGESCILASINLHQMYDKKLKNINYDLLKNVTKIITRFLEDVTEITEAPLDYINQMTKNLRRLGVGVLGFADLLVELNIPYESEEAIELSEYLSWFINFHAWETSFELAKERGAFGYYDKDMANLHVINKVLYFSPFEKSNINREKLRETGVRNVACTSIAPTGSIAIIGGVNSAIEPFFALAYKRNITEGIGNVAKDHIYETNPALERKLQEYGYDKEIVNKILEYSFDNGTLTGCDLVSEELQKLFKTANEISWKTHVDIQAAWQEYFSNAISKTINIPENSTVQDIYDIYLYMWEVGLKGGTIYRNNSKSFQILEKPEKEQ